MKIAYITGDITHNRNFAFFHDLLANFPVGPGWIHKVCLILPRFDRILVQKIKERGVCVDAVFEDFQPTPDAYWEKICQFTSDCDVIISGNITNLDDVLRDDIRIPIISVSLAEQGYRSSMGSYGNFYKSRFNKVAISKTAVEAFPEHVRGDVSVIYPGIDPSRLSQKVRREQLRNSWFPGRSDTVKLLLFIGSHHEKKGFRKLLEALDNLPSDWKLMILSSVRDMGIPEHLHGRIMFCSTSYDVADIYLACDCFVLPTEHEGFSSSLLEAWFLQIPTVTTRHKSMLELMGRHPDVNFGSLVDVDCTPKDLAESIQKAVPSPEANQCVLQHYMASNMVENWHKYLGSL